MTTARTPRFAAFALALVLTLSIFSSVTRLAAPEHGGAVLARVTAVEVAPT
jgi:hypothetical protein